MPDEASLWSLRGGLGRETSVPFTVAGGQVLAALEKRIGIVIYPPAVDDIVVSFRQGFLTNEGCRVKAGGPPLVMRLEDFGPLVTGKVYGRTTGAGPQTVGIVEVGNSI